MSTQTLPSIKNYIDTELVQQISSDCELWVYASPKSIKLLAACKEKKQVTGLTVLEIGSGSIFQKGLFELRSLLEGLTMFSQQYRHIHLVFETPYFTLIPEALFTADKEEILINSLHEIPKFYTVKCNRYLADNVVAAYAIPDIFCSTLKVLFPEASVNHYATALIEATRTLKEKTIQPFYVNIHENYIDLIYFKENHLQFINTFKTEAETDIIYFILSVADQQNLQVNVLQLVIMGDINSSGTLLTFLKKYIPNVSFIKRTSDYNFPASFREFEPHHHFSTLAVLLCE